MQLVKSGSTIKYPFHVGYQEKIIKFLIEENKIEYLQYMDWSLFDTIELREIFNTIKKYGTRFLQMPDYTTLKTKCGGIYSKDDQDLPETKKDILKTIRRIQKKVIIKPKQIEDNLSDFVKAQEQRKLVLQMSEDFQRGKYETVKYRNTLDKIIHFGEYGGEGICLNEWQFDPAKRIPMIRTHLPKLNEWLNGGLEQGELGIVWGMPNIGKCVEENSRIIIANGGVKKIKDVVIGDMVVGLDEFDLKLKPLQVKAVVNQGNKDVYNVKMHTGREIITTPDHPFYTINGWKKLKELKCGDYVASAKRLSFFGKETIGNKKAKILGYMLAEGGVTTSSITFTTGDKEILKDFSRLVESEFNVNINKRNKYTYGISGDWKGNGLTKWIQEIGLLGCKAENKYIPNIVYEFSESETKEFLNALFSGDGSIYQQKEKSWVIEYSSMSELLINGVQSLLTKFGIVARKTNKRTNFGTIAYRLIITKAIMIEIFCRKIGWTGVKRKRLQNFKGLKRAYKYYDESIPKEIWYYIRKKMKENNITSRELCGYKSVNFDRNISIPRLIKYAKKLNDNKLMKFCESDIHWDRIDKIIDMGKRICYDIQTSGGNFIAEDIVVHNTFFLIDMAIAASNIGKNVFYFTMELREQNVAMRFAQAVARMKTMSIVNKPKKFNKRFRREMVNKGKIFIKEYPIGGATISHLAGYIQEIEAQKGIKPDVIMVDSADYMMPLKWHEDDHERLAEIIISLRNLGQELNVPVWTVSQVKQEDYYKELRLTSGGRTARKVEIADVVIGAYPEMVSPQDAKLNHLVEDVDYEVIEGRNYFMLKKEIWIKLLKIRRARKAIGKFLCGLDWEYSEMTQLKKSQVIRRRAG